MAWEALPIELGEIIFQHATDSDLHMITSFSTVSKEFNAWNNLCFRLEKAPTKFRGLAETVELP